MWRKLIPRLAERYRVICPDLRGFGWSDAPPGRYELRTLADDLIGLVDALALDRVRLVGHDWGGYTCFLACLRAPGRFERLASLSVISPWYRPPPSLLLLVGASYQLPIVAPLIGPLVARRPAYTRFILKAGAARNDCFSDEELETFTRQFREPVRARATVALYRSFQFREVPRLLRRKYDGQRLELPGLGLWGDHDPVITARSYRGTEGHADSFRVEKIAGVGHFLPDEAPDAVLAQLEPFLAG